MFDEMDARYLGQNQEKFPSLALLLETKIQNTKSIYHSTMILFISTMRSFDYDAKDKSNKW